MNRACSTIALLLACAWTSFASATPDDIESKNSLGQTLRNVCAALDKRLSQTSDTELARAAQPCRALTAETGLALVRGLSHLANKDAGVALDIVKDRLSFLATQLRSLRAALVRSRDWTRPPAAFFVGNGIRELSGLAFDPRRQIVFGMSDNDPRIVAIDRSSKRIEFFDLDGIKVVDPEGLLIGPDGLLWLMDTGDNKHQRDQVEIDVFNPDDRRGGHAPVQRKLRIRYPPGKHPNVEASFIRGGTLFLIEKADYRAAELFTVNLADVSPVLNAQSFGFLPPGSPISDAYYDQRTDRLFVLGWFDLREIVGWRGGPRTPRLLWENFFGQQEGLTFAPDESAFYLGIEEGNVYRLPARL